MRARAKDPQRLILTKANSRSTVHRPAYLDYIAVKRVGETGEIDGEYRFLGLYTHAAYHESITRIPVLRRKLASVLERAGVAPDSHDGQDLTEILEGYPREELFQISVEDLTPIALGVLRLRDAPADPAVPAQGPLRPVHVLPGVPAQGPVHHRGAAAHPGDPARGSARGGGRVQRHGRRLGTGPAARRGARRAGQPRCRTWMPPRWRRGWRPPPGPGTRTWPPRRCAPSARSPPGRCSTPAPAAIPETYKTDVPAANALTDLVRVNNLLKTGEDIAFDLWEAESYTGGRPVTEHGKHGVWRLTIYRIGSPITLTDVLPRLQHMGVDVVDEHPYEFAGPSVAKPFWIYDFGLRRSRSGARRRAGRRLRPAWRRAGRILGRASGQVKSLFEDALDRLWQEKIEDDGFNALVLDAHLNWQQVVVLRVYAKYLRQAGITFSQRYIERVLRPERGHHPAARPAVRVQVRSRPPAGGRASAARPSPRRSAASSTRSPSSTTTGSCAATWG